MTTLIIILISLWGAGAVTGVFALTIAVNGAMMRLPDAKTRICAYLTMLFWPLAFPLVALKSAWPIGSTIPCPDGRQG